MIALEAALSRTDPALRQGEGEEILDTAQVGTSAKATVMDGLGHCGQDRLPLACGRRPVGLPS